MPQRYSRKNNAKNGEVAVLDRRRRVARLYLGGHTQTQIAAALGCSQATVCRDLAAVREEWKAEAREAFEEKFRDDLERLEWAERRARGGWEHSKSKGCPDPRYLESLLQCLGMRVRLTEG